MGHHTPAGKRAPLRLKGLQPLPPTPAARLLRLPLLLLLLLLLLSALLQKPGMEQGHHPLLPCVGGSRRGCRTLKDCWQWKCCRRCRC